MQKCKNAWTILLLGTVILLTMAWVDAVLGVAYLGKSFIKMFLFLGIPHTYAYLNQDKSLIQLFRVESKRKLIWSLGLGISIYAIIMGAYLFLQNWIDLAGIQYQLTSHMAINEGNFVMVALYISLINSLLEEFFFRGFLFMNLKQHISTRVASVVSASAFAIYHVAILSGWFSPALFVLAMAGLFIGGLIFNVLTAWSENIYASWLAHLMANLAINTVGFVMFGIINFFN